ncbi:PepSY domain-containing protein [Corynebacterium uropygiale]|uniref:PepSY domain-containing protein n=1 Tax=Corynebacterium uropygiale TaxID=1775911 RepID=A0A9X1QQN0_9CORY|nr:PepSY domain-containing protein [Corynebacterium uropygiale]MCF4007346.1 PepSY domain-containing protein [Corynebacterium uropygiale]
MHRIHVIAGIFIAPLLFVATLTGFLYALAPSLEKAVYHEQMSAPVAAQGVAPLPIADQVRAAEKARPGDEADAVEVAGDAAHTTRVLFNDPSLISKSYKHAVFVDPGDGSVRGDEVQYGSSDALPFRAWLSEGHRRLWLGEPGRLYSEAAASWMGALTIGGLWLWWDRCRRKRNHSTTRRGRLMRNHAWVGVVVALGLLFLTATGLTWSSVAGANIATAREHLNWIAPKPETTISAPASPAAPAADGASPASPAWEQADRVLDTARAEGLDGKLILTPPEGEGEAWTVKEARQEWRTDMNTITVDGATGSVVDEVRWSDWPIMAKMAEWLINAHMGILFGWVNQLLLALLALGLGAMIVWGWLMWFARNRHAYRAGSLPRPVGWGRVPPMLIVLCVIYSLIAPLFGITLVIFLLGDGIYQHFRARRAHERPRARAHAD